MSGIAEMLRFPSEPAEGDLHAGINGHVYHRRGNEWQDVSGLYEKAGQMPEPPDDGALYGYRRLPGMAHGEWVRMPEPDLRSVVARDGSRAMQKALTLAGAPVERNHASNKAYIDQWVAYLNGEIERIKLMLAPKPPRDLGGEARGRTY